jgi:hypothetical protein
MWLFKKKKQVKDEDEVKPSASDKVAGKIAGAGLKIQKAFGNKMNKLFENMNQLKLKRGLIVFTLLAGGYSLYLIVTAITKPIKQNSFKVEQIDVPKHFDKTGDKIIEQDAMVDEETYINIQHFKKYMDSLKFNNTKQYDSILTTRPGLMDSVQMLEEIYHSQKVK